MVLDFGGFKNVPRQNAQQGGLGLMLERPWLKDQQIANGFYNIIMIREEFQQGMESVS